MTATAIIWAITSTVGLVAVYLLMRREFRLERRAGAKWQARAEYLAGEITAMRDVRAQAVASIQFWIKRNGDLLERLHEAEDKLRAIELQRHNSAKKARAAQLERQRTVIAARKAELDRGITAQTDRVAA